MHCRRKWQPTPVFLPGESRGQRSLVGCRLWRRQSWTRLKRLSSSSSRIEQWFRVWSQRAWIYAPTLPLTSCVTLAKLQNFFVLQTHLVHKVRLVIVSYGDHYRGWHMVVRLQLFYFNLFFLPLLYLPCHYEARTFRGQTTASENKQNKWLWLLWSPTMS